MSGFDKYLLTYPNLRYGQAFYNYFSRGSEYYNNTSEEAFLAIHNDPTLSALIANEYTRS